MHLLSLHLCCRSHKPTHARARLFSGHSCPPKVQKALEDVPGVMSATVDYSTTSATVEGAAPVEDLVGALQEAGYQASVSQATTAPASTSSPSKRKPQSAKAAAKAPHGSKRQTRKKGKPASGSTTDAAPVAKATYSVSGMSCASCVANIEGTISAMPGIASVRVALLAERADVQHDPAIITAEAIGTSMQCQHTRTPSAHPLLLLLPLDLPGKAITARGYPAELLSTSTAGGKGGAGTSMDEVRLSVTGMSCASCVAKIENHLMELPGVESASVALTTNEARISFNGDKTGVRTILAVVNDLGYHAEVQQEGNDVERMQQQQAKAVSVGCGTNLH